MKNRWLHGVLATVAAGLVAVAVWAPRDKEVQASTSATQRPPGGRGFASSINQRNEMVTELKRLNMQMQALLRVMNSGRLKVIVVELPDAKAEDK